MKIIFNSCRKFKRLALVIFAMLSISALAQVYPAKPIRLYVGFAPGGPADGSARIIGEVLAKTLKQPIVIDNKPGAGGTIAAATVAQSPADGYTLLMASSGHAGNGAYYGNLNFDTVKSFKAVGGVSATPVVILVAADSPYKTLANLLDDARANPDKVSVATGGGATLTNLAAEVLKNSAKVRMVAVPYKGTAPVLTAVMGGEVSVGIDTVSGSIGLIRSGKLRALAVTSAKRSSVLPDVPSVAETKSLSDFDITGWYGVLAPSNTPAEVVTILNREVNKALATPAVIDKLAALGADPIPGSPEQFNSLLVSETSRWSGVIKRLGLKSE
jgi:tripartite-type tricarboxylate transporter receptor subunit TctC